MTEEALLLKERRGEEFRLTLNRPRAFNSLSGELLTELERAIDELAVDASVRVVVLTGNGKAFCAGHDLKEIGADRSYGPVHALFTHCSRVMMKLTRMPQPVIARVDGIATAAGCQLVAACDLAICSDISRFATSGVKFGLFCSTPMVALSRNVGRKLAMEMLLTGDFIDAQRALAEGLVNEVVAPGELDDAVGRMVARLTDKPASVLALGKRAFYAQLELGMEAAYAMTTDVIVDNALGKEFEEGLEAFTGKRKPVWNAA
ncbi:MAG: enoyl-CoA hydratase [Geminicoccaceae bacterium]|nr:enoyl-CoA hydratase [Geminicoccaceae bacterium]MCB9942429.1 enoyl-CoA hydratase [Geminicoccaceae bacterium]